MLLLKVIEMDSQPYIIGSKFTSESDEDIKELFSVFNYEEQICFIRGFFDTNGYVSKSLTHPKCVLRCNNETLRQIIKQIIPIPCSDIDGQLEYKNVNVIEFLHIVYKKAEFMKYNENYGIYRSLLYCWEPSFHKHSGFQYKGWRMVFKFSKTLPNAIVPTKAHITDTGYDLCLVQKVKEENGMILYDTGIAVQPPIGFYFELVGRSSISKTGYILANSIGIIDASYTGSLKVALIKVNKKAKDLELPARLVQLIPRQFIHLDAIEVTSLEDTTRAQGGFGSSGQGVLTE